MSVGLELQQRDAPFDDERIRGNVTFLHSHASSCIAVERWGPYGSSWINDVEGQIERLA
jgi:hypothetical protein